jgi:hypothetical protein
MLCLAITRLVLGSGPTLISALVFAIAPRCTVVRHATRARPRVLRGEDATPERNPHHQHFRACSFRRQSVSRSYLDQLPLSRCVERDSKLYLRRYCPLAIRDVAAVNSDVGQFTVGQSGEFLHNAPISLSMLNEANDR